MSEPKSVTRREFVGTAAKTAGATSILSLVPPSLHAAQRRRYAIVGTGIRASNMWGRDLVERYSDLVKFVGLCDINRKRVDIAKGLMGAECPTFTDFDDSLEKVLEVEVLMEDHPSFDIPTTGVIVDGALFVIANSQLRRYDENRRLLPLEELHEPVILRIPLDR